ncbi:MAG: efflux transporter outer membrane subunit [Deltaproteobacteria bacterium]|nr:efflux transporter outer membrane subunit [Deltaproteobacteria bacterium]
MYILRLLLLIFLLLQPLLFCGCMDLRPEPVDPVPANFPNHFSLYNDFDDSILPWWSSFNNAELDQLIKNGLTGNLSLQEAWARLSQSRALAAKSKSDQYPDLWVDGTGAHLRTDSSDSRQQTSNNFGLGLIVGYEIDLWGRIRAKVRGAELDLEATREDVNVLMLSLSGMIGEAWVELLSQRQQQQQLTQELGLNTKLLELIEMRFAMSRASALDVYQQGQTVTALKGGLINSRARRQLQLNQLALLTGRFATTDLQLIQVEFPKISPLPPTGLPADLLARRPDIRAAGLHLQSANWQVAAARADRLPRISLGGSINYTSTALDLLLDNWILRLAASVTGPIFDGGYRRAEVERSRAVVDERLAAYRGTVLIAIRDVEDALAREQQYRDFLTNIDQQLQLTKMAYREATRRYLNGLVDFLPVLREQINLITFQLDRIRTGADLLKARISLYKALGGSWMEEMVEPEKT